MKKALIFLLALFFSVVTQKTYATHIMGAEITYTAIDTLKFKFQFVIYRDCRGISMPTWPVNVRALDKSISQSMGKMPTSSRIIEDVTPVCENEISCGSPANEGFGAKGIERHMYTMTFDFISSPLNKFVTGGACWVRIETSQNARNGAITTGPEGNFYTYADINICKAPANNTPSFNNRPVANLCCNEPVNISLGGSDYIDNDSLSYAFSHPMRGYNTNTRFTGDFAYNNPFTAYYPGSLKFPYVNTAADPPIGIYLNPKTGDLTFTPTKCDEVSVAVVEVKEWRKINGKYEHVGTIRRDMQYEISQCPSNTPPRFIGSDQLTFKPNQCDSIVSFFVKVSDFISTQKKYKDTVEITLEQSPPGSTIEMIDSVSDYTLAKVTWKPDYTISDKTDKIIFSVRASDDACPYRGLAEKSYVINLIKDTTSAQVDVRVFEDKDQNCIKSWQEKGIANRSILGYNTLYSEPSMNYHTDSSGEYKLCADVGVYQVKLLEHPFYRDICNDSSLRVLANRQYKISFGSNIKTNSVSGRVIADYNSSCSIDQGEKGMSGVLVKATPGNHVTTTDRHGAFVLPLPNGKYTLELSEPLFKESCGTSHSITIQNSEIITGKDFYATRDSGNVSVNLVTPRQAVLGRSSTFTVILENNGNDTIKNNGIMVEHDPLLVIQKTANNLIISDSVAYFYTPLNPYSFQRIKASFIISDTTVRRGSELYLKVKLLTGLSDTLDVVKSDNTDYGYVVVSRSFDPNIKVTKQPNQITAFDHTLDYTIHFQNTGDAPAYYVELRDTLPEELDESTIQIVGASHERMNFILQDRVVYCIFDQIYLPGKDANEEKSMGFVSFKINQKEHFKKKTNLKAIPREKRSESCVE